MGNFNIIVDSENIAATRKPGCIEARPVQRWHSHNELELHFFKNFSGEALIGDYKGEISTNSLFLLGPKLPHCWTGKSMIPTPDNNCTVLFSDFKIVDLFEMFSELKQLEVMLVEAKYGVEFSDPAAIQEVGKLMFELDKMEGCAVIGGLFSILDQLLKCDRRILNPQGFSNQQSVGYSKNIEKVITYVKSNCKELITLKKASEIANMSPPHFCRKFKKIYGTGFIDYLNKLRIERACKMLEDTREPISIVAHECGYMSLSSFNRNFQKYVSKSPSEFRRFEISNACN